MADSIKIFKVGETYTYPMLFGGRVTVEIIDRTPDTISFRECWVAEDTGEPVMSADIESKSIQYNTDVDGGEMAEMWDYYDHHCYIFAKEPA
jgi:hypothetical protein